MSETTAPVTGILNQTFPYTCAKGTINGVTVSDLSGGDFMVEAAAAEEAATLSEALDKQQWRTIFAAVESGLPVIVARKTKDGYVEKVTAIIEYATVHDANSSKIRVRYWGFGHYIWASEILWVETPDVKWEKLEEGAK